jgi:lysozyme family protein
VNTSFPAALAAVLRSEGGYCDNPHDPGGATNQGVTQAVYDAWRAERKLFKRSVRFISAAEVSAIYLERYWNACRCDDLPAGVDYAVFDFAVNSGPGRAAKELQRAVDVADDGRIGPATIAAVNAADPRRVIHSLCSARQCYLESLSSFEFFGTGWTRRVASVEVQARSMAA